MTQEALAEAARELAKVSELIAHPARHHLVDYCEYANPSWQRAPHLELLCLALEAVERYIRGEAPATDFPSDELIDALRAGEPLGIDRLMVLMPPQHGKTEVTSRLFPGWFAGRNPQLKTLLTAYNATWAREISIDARRYFEWAVPQLFGVDISPETEAANNWHIGHAGTEKYHGRFHATGFGGDVTGRPADLFLIDDPEKNAEEAESPAYQRKKINWFRSVSKTRLSEHGAIVICVTWWAQRDLVGRLLEEMAQGGEHWTVLRLPAIAWDHDPIEDRLPDIAQHKDPIGRRTGEALWPTMKSLEFLLRQKRDLHRYWDALYQQCPTGALEGALWNLDTMIEPYRIHPKRAPEFDRAVVAVDPSGGGEDDVGIGVAGRAWVWSEEDRTQLRHGYPLVDLSGPYGDDPLRWARIVVEAYYDYGADCVIAEQNFGGELVRSNIHTIDPDVPVVIVHASKGKAQRAAPVANLYQQGRVHHVGRLAELEEELTTWVAGPDGSGWSPNRLDWVVWALTDLLLEKHSGGFAARYGFGPKGPRRREGGVRHPLSPTQAARIVAAVCYVAAMTARRRRGIWRYRHRLSR